ncbi:hypothetical protein [Maribacter aquivivus]|uniref:hypothetical protein n=1 Tax=Maribacter aquivivus TaxID=228958 RepID=UPI002492E0B2|nr:hypothetical protein [Maribacter aquivivus]
MERPFESQLKLSRNSLEKTRVNFIFNFNQNDKILVWIVGFSVTAISLIISKISNINEVYSNSTLKIVLGLLVMSILTGIVYRFAALLFLTKYQTILFYLEGAFSKEKTMPTETREFKKPNDIHEIYQKLKYDFDQDYSDIIILYNQASNEQSKKYYIEYLKTEYSRLADWSKNEYEYAEKYVKGVFKKAFGFSQKRIDKIYEKQNHSLYLKMWGWVCGISIAVCIVSFISALLLLVLKFN